MEQDIYIFPMFSKWKADKSGVFAIALGPTEDQLLSAGRTIKLWDLVKYELLQVRFGSFVITPFNLLPVNQNSR